MTVEVGQHLCHSVSSSNACTQPAAPVISTGKKWSGEISLRNGTSNIVAGDFWAQSINRKKTLTANTAVQPRST